ncbi:DUF481 domain-containing protein [Pedobacter sp. AW1-32]|uniref:DUF481 domain-containing protein n=1 Tax=Pedobacter sp. AW1-32 TaxID=3383026 RepID=UPI003FEE219B
MNKFLSTLLFLLISFASFAQFTDSTQYRIQATVGGNINRTDESKTYLLNNALKFGIGKKRFALNLNAGWLYGNQDDNLTNNDVNTTLDFNLYHSDSRSFYYWGLGNYLSSYSLNIKNQGQLGAGVAYSFIDTDKNYLNVSNGILFELTNRLINDSISEEYTTFRNSFRISFKWTPKEFIVLSGMGMIQNSLQYKDDYILKANSAITFKVFKTLGLTSALTYNRFSETRRENFLLTYGLTFEKYF